VVTTSPAAIRIRDVCKAWGRGRHAVRALDGVSFDVPTASITGLIGPNASGKSTLLHVVVGLVLPDRGSCALFGRPSTDARSRARVGFVPEEIASEPGMRLSELLRVHRALADAEDEAADESALGEPGASIPPSLPLGRCSLGTARRFALRCAAIGKPRLLVLDEPASGLDVDARAGLFQSLLRFRGRGGSVLISSHVLADLEAVCDRFVFLDRGKVVRCVHRLCGSAPGGGLRLVVRGVTRDLLAGVLGSCWNIVEQRDALVASTGRSLSDIPSLLHEVEAVGATVVRLSRGPDLERIYREGVGR
jgi:ABC-type multidrug transport system ATPase subunit